LFVIVGEIGFDGDVFAEFGFGAVVVFLLQVGESETKVHVRQVGIRGGGDFQFGDGFVQFFAVEIGFAFDPKGDGKMAIHGGYGIFYEHTNGNEGNTESLEGSAPLVLTAAQSNIPGYENIGAGAGPVPFFPLTVVSIPHKAQWPYVQQWNLNVQKELPAHFIVSVAYVGSKGTHLTLLSDGNQIQPLPAGQNPFGAGETLYNTGILVPDPVTGVPTPVGACAGSDPILNPGK
jgi:hypothetical protein